MNNDLKKQLIEGYEGEIEKAEAKIEKLSKPSQKSSVHMRAAERDFWRKNIKKYKEQLKELEDE